MSTEPLIDEDYASEEDSDFAPDTAQAEDASESEADDEEVVSKRKRAADNADDAVLDSGDEAIISKAKKRRKKSKHKDGGDDDEGGKGGLIKTRSMRAHEEAERKALVVSGPVTVDVDDLWATMTAGPVLPSKPSSEDKENAYTSSAQGPKVAGSPSAVTSGQERRAEPEPSRMIKIKRTYNFAGKVHTEEKLVPRDSAEAKVYLASLGDKAPEVEEPAEDEATKQQPRKAFRSRFEPVSEGLTQRADLNLGLAARLQMREEAKAKKLNVVEKSRLDWAGFVDKEGIKDELELAGKSKKSYASREDFLARVEAKREEDARRARMAGRA